MTPVLDFDANDAFLVGHFGTTARVFYVTDAFLVGF